jgi:hypothetical protein
MKYEVAETRTIDFTSKVESYDPDRHSIWSKISTTTPDYVKDIVLPDGLTFMKDLDDKEKRPAVLLNHRPAPDGLNHAKCLNLKIVKDGILAETQFASKTTIGKDLEYLYSEGFMTDFSVRIEPVDEKSFEKNEKGGLTFKKWYMPEYSLVSIGMNPQAMTLSYEQLDTICKNLESPELIREFEEAKFEKRLDSIENKINKVYDSIVENEDNTMSTETKSKTKAEETNDESSDNEMTDSKKIDMIIEMLSEMRNTINSLNQEEDIESEEEKSNDIVDEDGEDSEEEKEKQLKEKAKIEFDKLFKHLAIKK